jgi:hypothetical protein
MTVGSHVIAPFTNVILIGPAAWITLFVAHLKSYYYEVHGIDGQN